MDSEELRRQFRTLMDREEFQDALALINTQSETLPSTAEFSIALVTCYREIGDLEEAKFFLDYTMTLEHADCLESLIHEYGLTAESYLEKGDYQNAKLLSAQALEIDPDYAEYQAIHADSLYRLRNYTEAKFYAYKAVELSEPDPKSTNVEKAKYLLILANCLMDEETPSEEEKLDNQKEAEEYLLRSIELDLLGPAQEYSLMVLYQRIGRTEDYDEHRMTAEEKAAAAGDKYFQNLLAQESAANQTLSLSGDDSEIRDVKQYISSEIEAVYEIPSKPFTIFGELIAAIEEIQSKNLDGNGGLEGNGDQLKNGQNLLIAKAIEESSEDEYALEQLEPAFQLKSEDPVLLSLAAHVRMKSARYKDAWALLDAAWVCDGGDEGPHPMPEFYMAELFLTQGDFQKAKEAAEKSLSKAEALPKAKEKIVEAVNKLLEEIKRREQEHKPDIGDIDPGGPT